MTPRLCWWRTEKHVNQIPTATKFSASVEAVITAKEAPNLEWDAKLTYMGMIVRCSEIFGWCILDAAVGSRNKSSVLRKEKYILQKTRKKNCTCYCYTGITGQILHPSRPLSRIKSFFYLFHCPCKCHHTVSQHHTLGG